MLRLLLASHAQRQAIAARLVRWRLSSRAPHRIIAPKHSKKERRSEADAIKGRAGTTASPSPNKDLDALKDELGDLLLQVVYHAQMASEHARFDFDDVVQAITEKMIRRHPHVFADVTLRATFLATPMWA
jgi:NTP pyrophosphatase (non-canonical NTP hydrolase)